MSPWSWIPFLRVTLSFALGIMLYDNFTLRQVLAGTLTCLLVFYLLALFQKRFSGFLTVRNLTTGICITLGFFFMGALRMTLNQPEHNPHHLVNATLTEDDLYLLEITSAPTQTAKFTRYQAECHKIIRSGNDSSQVQGSLLLYIRKDSSSLLFRPGHMLLLDERLQSIPPPDNPGVFDYNRYMAARGIYYQVFADPSKVFFADSLCLKKNHYYAISAQQTLQNLLKRFLNGEESREIIPALVLGIKDFLSTDTRQAYATAGAMHVLAVSGLHVGIIYMILNFLLVGTAKIRYGWIIRLTVSLAVLWVYAVLTGLSPSVIRAVIMFSVMVIGKQFNKKQNIYNSLCLAALITLVYQPTMLMEVGFQLSYLAVTGIVFLYPRIVSVYQPRNRLARFIWESSSVSLAAQLATVPVSIYYFHIFPTYFLFTNLVVIPAAFFLLCTGLLLLAAGSLSELAGNWVGWVLDTSVKYLDIFIDFFAELPLARINGLEISGVQMILLYLIIISTALVFRLRSAFLLRTAYLLAFIFLTDSLVAIAEVTSARQTVFYKIKNRLVIDVIRDGNVKSYSLQPETKELTYQINPYRTQMRLPHVTETHPEPGVELPEVGNMLSGNGNRILVVSRDLEKIKVSEKIRTDILVVASANRAEKLLSTFSFRQLIISSKLSWYKARKLSDELEKLDVPHYNIQEEGALILK